MAITAAGRERLLNLVAADIDRIEVVNGGFSEDKPVVPDVDLGNQWVESIVFFDETEANFHIGQVNTFAGAVTWAENAADFIKTDLLTLTVIRRDRVVTS